MAKCLQKDIKNDMDVTNNAWCANAKLIIDLDNSNAVLEVNGYPYPKAITDGVSPNCQKEYNIYNIEELKTFKAVFDEIVAKMCTDTSQEFAGAKLIEIPK